MNDAQDMQDGLILLKNAITTMQSDMQEIQTSMAIIASGSYVGNNQSSITITFNRLSKTPKMIFISAYINGSRQEIYTGIGMNNCVVGIDTYTSSGGTYGFEYGGIYSASFTTSRVTMTRKSTYNCMLNNSGVTYNYILLG